MKNSLLLSLSLVMIVACAPKISTSLTKSLSPVEETAEVKILDLKDPIPGKYEELGYVKIGETAFTSHCSYDIVLKAAQKEVRKAGGNAMKLIQHTLPDGMSTCHKIIARILKVDNFNAQPVMTKEDSLLAKADYALVHIYRPTGTGALISYNLHYGDSVLCKVKNFSAETIKVYEFGPNYLWAKTEVREELNVDFKMGKEYYIRCGLTPGIAIGHPQLEYISNTEIGKMEYNVITRYKQKEHD